jgi:hypothetical protein
MRVRHVVSVFAGVLLVVGMAAAAAAQSITECQALITALRVRTETVVISGKNADKDRAGLVGKLNEASDKLDHGKFCDAIQKLNDFKARVQQLVDAAKVTVEDGAQLTNDADAAIRCIQNVATSAGITCAA